MPVLGQRVREIVQRQDMVRSGGHHTTISIDRGVPFPDELVQVPQHEVRGCKLRVDFRGVLERPPRAGGIVTTDPDIAEHEQAHGVGFGAARGSRGDAARTQERGQLGPAVEARVEISSRHRVVPKGRAQRIADDNRLPADAGMAR